MRLARPRDAHPSGPPDGALVFFLTKSEVNAICFLLTESTRLTGGRAGLFDRSQLKREVGKGGEIFYFNR